MPQTITTQRLLLRPLGPGDLHTTHLYASDAQTTRYMLLLPSLTLDETRIFLENAAAEWEKDQPDFYEFAIVLDGQHIGAVSLYPERESGTAELGWILNRAYQGQGYALEAVLALKHFATETLGFKKLRAHCDSRNRPSQRLMEKIGFGRLPGEGVRRYPDARGEAGEYTYFLQVGG